MNTSLRYLVSSVLFITLAASADAAPRRVVVDDVLPAKTQVRRFTVNLSSRDTISMSFPVTGKLGVRQAKKDTEVHKGDILAELEPELFQQKREKAKIEADRAEASYRRMASVQKGVSEESRSKAEADMKAAQAELRIAEKDLIDTKLIAPFDGVVVQTHGDIGQVIPSGDMVTRIHSKAVNVKLNVPERMICRDGWKERLQNKDIRVEVAACPGILLPARFVDIDLRSENKAQTFCAAYQIDTPPGYTFYEGMSATLYMPVSDPEDLEMVDVPFDAIRRTPDGKAFVWEAVTESDGRCRARRREVVIRHRNCALVSVTGNLKPGAKIAELGAALLAEGMEIDPVEE